MFSKIKCSLGIHEWGTQEYAPNLSGCREVRVCQRCSWKERTLIELPHAWTGWNYINSKSCNQTRHCQRCKAERNRIEHDWTDWTRLTQRILTATCTRCSTLKVESLNNLWEGRLISYYAGGNYEKWTENDQYPSSSEDIKIDIELPSAYLPINLTESEIAEIMQSLQWMIERRIAPDETGFSDVVRFRNSYLHVTFKIKSNAIKKSQEVWGTTSVECGSYPLGKGNGGEYVWSETRDLYKEIIGGKIEFDLFFLVEDIKLN